MLSLGFAEDEFVIEKEVYNHVNCGSEYEHSGGKGKFVIERNMEGFDDLKGEFIDRGEEAE